MWQITLYALYLTLQVPSVLANSDLSMQKDNITKSINIFMDYLLVYRDMFTQVLWGGGKTKVGIFRAELFRGKSDYPRGNILVSKG